MTLTNPPSQPQGKPKRQLEQGEECTGHCWI